MIKIQKQMMSEVVDWKIREQLNNYIKHSSIGDSRLLHSSFPKDNYNIGIFFFIIISCCLLFFLLLYKCNLDSLHT